MKKIFNKLINFLFSKKVLKTLGVIFGAGFLTVVGVFIFFMKDLPDPSKINKRVIDESTKIYDRTGQHLLYEIHGEENRTLISINQIPDVVKYATIALEDQDFYSHSGVDFRGIARAAVKDIIKRKIEQGGSTITQQFVKNSILTSEKRISRKIKEVVLALEIEQKFDKEEILQMYLNEIPYGSNAYGIEAAAQTFFGEHASELTLAQSVLLASLPNAPTFYSPFGSNTDWLLVRWKSALDKMADLGYITEEQAKNASEEDILSQVQLVKDDIKAPHFVMHVKEQLVEEFGEEEMEKIGMSIYTTLDWNYQQIAEEVVREKVDEIGEQYGFTNAALVALNPKNGQILAMVGSKDYFDQEIDGNVNVATRFRQPGSSFKPYVYAQALETGYTRKTILFDVETNFSTSDDEEDDYIPRNYLGNFNGPVQLEDALATSLNIPAVKFLYLVGPEKAVSFAKLMGLEGLNEPSRYGLSLVLGGGEVKLLNHVGAFSVFANEGKKQNKTAILRIEDSKGEIIREFQEEEGEQVIEKETALEIIDILSDDKLRAPLFGAGSLLNVPGHQVAAKTGTTNEYRDGWLLGATPYLAAGVWTGNNDNTAMKEGSSGSSTAGPIWSVFMRRALENQQSEEFDSPEDFEKTGIDILDGKYKVKEELEVCEYEKDKFCLANSSCPDSLVEDKDFYNARTILYYIDKDNPTAEDGGSKGDSQYRGWQDGIDEWVKDEEDDKEQREIPEKECKDDYFEDYRVEISIIDPSNEETLTSKDLKVSTKISGDGKVKDVEFYIDGSPVGKDSKSPYSLNYEIPDSKNGGEIEIRAKVRDDNGGDDEDKIKVKINF
ncbi:MAG: penicillin-binding protein [Candidatus Moranbacteria bacterium]|nr:penicillin-binding protein [Candidatus Moranbacteria bacterium]